MASLFSPEGMLLSDDDAFRRFGGNYVVVRIVDGKSDTTIPVRVSSLRFPYIGLETEKVGIIEVSEKHCELVHTYPPVGVYNWRKGVLLFSRTGNRQWHLGLGNEGTSLIYEAEKGGQEVIASFEIMRALYFPTFSNIDTALKDLYDLNADVIYARALSKRFWLKKLMKDKKVDKVIMYRNKIPVGLFLKPDVNSFYPQSGCEVFNEDIKQLLRIS